MIKAFRSWYKLNKRPKMKLDWKMYINNLHEGFVIRISPLPYTLKNLI